MATVRVRYQTFEFGETDIHVRTLRDRQQFSDDLGVASKLGISSATWPLFGIVWRSGEVLAHYMYDYKIAGKRILELGCGIALASHVLNHRLADITATDYHPETEHFLIANTELNGGANIPFVRTAWSEEDFSLGEFDLIIGSDVLYERGHGELLPEFVNRHAKIRCEVIIVDPGRSQQGIFSRKMQQLGFSHKLGTPHKKQEDVFSGKIHHFNR